MKPIKLYDTAHIESVDSPEDIEELSLDSSALKFFTDFQKVKPLVVEASLSAVEAQRLMKKTHVRMKIVIDEQDKFIGIITDEDLDDRVIMQRVSKNTKREDIPMAEFMILKKDLKALDYDEISKATIADVILVLKELGRQHCLVVDEDTLRVRGVFSASDISRKLHFPIDIQDPTSIYRVISAVH